MPIWNFLWKKFFLSKPKFLNFRQGTTLWIELGVSDDFLKKFFFRPCLGSDTCENFENVGKNSMLKMSYCLSQQKNFSLQSSWNSHRLSSRMRWSRISTWQLHRSSGTLTKFELKGANRSQKRLNLTVFRRLSRQFASDLAAVSTKRCSSARRFSEGAIRL